MTENRETTGCRCSHGFSCHVCGGCRDHHEPDCPECQPIWWVTTGFFKDGGLPIVYQGTVLGPVPKQVAFLLRSLAESRPGNEGRFFIDSRESGQQLGATG